MTGNLTKEGMYQINGVNQNENNIANTAVADVNDLNSSDSNCELVTVQGALFNEEWRNDMLAELKALIDNGTWSIVEKPEGTRLISSKWVFKRKVDAHGNFDKYKARLVVRGFTQQLGVNYDCTYAPVAKLVTFRILMAIAANHHYIIENLDIANAFLKANVDYDIYMKFPEGIE